MYYYFKVQPALTFEKGDNGVHKMIVYKSSGLTSVCSCTSPSTKVVKSLIESHDNFNSPSYKISRVPDKYFKIVMAKSKGVKKTTNINSNVNDVSITELFRHLINRSGRRLSKWILDITKYS